MPKKRPLSQSSPPAKHARRKHQEPISSSSVDVDQEASSYFTSTYCPSSERLKRFMKLLRAVITPDASDQEVKEELISIYWGFRNAYRLRTGFVSEDDFTKNVIRNEEHFFNVLRKAVTEGATEDDHQAVVTHPTKVKTSFQELKERAIIAAWNAEYV
ncbi:hypothetical protein B0F90DRAFT_1769493 [Multifurca ochricompacta]|uniref:Uncharacterized protein n=1 Tax=Multifurca ochricompacta TaxID=376703 RepID=A0AAD4QFT8_9AGAM|nr:hypothetical protein B0F90DRAFT_1773796 [Multifurca ochricompacta]KAI0292607.1 hypothetical protein B0F90DRAFT_1769493 [Multifurca ochricompacta]